MSVPRVFISYSHDSDQHKLWVLKLATNLQERGVDIYLDQWDVDLGDDLPRFMENIVKVDRVLIICTKKYVAKCNEVDAGGVPMERRLMSGQLMKGKPSRTFIPILRDNPDHDLPNFIGAGSFYTDFNDDTHFDENFWELAASIHGARVKKPPIGRNPFEKGLDAGFGNNGIMILRNLDLTGFRLTLEKGFYYISGISNGCGFVSKVATNGAFDEGFGEKGLVTFPKNFKSDKYGLSLYDHYYIDEHIYQITPDNPGKLANSNINNPQTLNYWENKADVIAMVTNDRPSGLFNIKDDKFGVCVFKTPGKKQPIDFFEAKTDKVCLEWARAKVCGDFLYLFGGTKGVNRELGIQRFFMDSTLDQKFGQDGFVSLKRGALFSHHVSDIVELTDRRIVAVGSGNEASIVCLLPDGTPEPKFGDKGYLQFRAAANSIGKFVDEYEGRIVLAGIEYDGNSIHNCFVAMLQLDGQADENFGNDGAVSVKTGSQDEILDVHIDDGKATILFQHDHKTEIRPRVGLARIHLA